MTVVVNNNRPEYEILEMIIWCDIDIKYSQVHMCICTFKIKIELIG